MSLLEPTPSLLHNLVLFLCVWVWAGSLCSVAQHPVLGEPGRRLWLRRFGRGVLLLAAAVFGLASLMPMTFGLTGPSSVFPELLDPGLLLASAGAVAGFLGMSSLLSKLPRFRVGAAVGLTAASLGALFLLDSVVLEWSPSSGFPLLLHMSFFFLMLSDLALLLLLLGTGAGLLARSALGDAIRTPSRTLRLAIGFLVVSSFLGVLGVRWTAPLHVNFSPL